MSQLNLQQVKAGDNISTVIDKLNYNFEQILLNGGGPQGSRGFIGAPGIPGLQGLRGFTGSTGEHGTYIFADTLDPDSFTSWTEIPRDGDIFIEAKPTFLNVWELLPGATASYWNLVETVSAPTSSWKSAIHQSAIVGTAYTDIINDTAFAEKIFIGSLDAFRTGNDPDAEPYLFSPGFTETTLVPSLSIPSSFSNTLSTFASSQNQIRLIGIGLTGATGALGATATTPSIQTNRGGVIHSLEGASGGGASVQIYRIINGDTAGDKFFSLGLNSARGTKLLYGDMLNRAGIGISEFEQLGASLNVAHSLAVGSSASGFYSSPTFKNNIGAVIEGNLAIGIKNNTLATGFFYGAGSTISNIIIDVNSSAGTLNYASLKLSNNIGIGATNVNSWQFYMDAYNNPAINPKFSSLYLKAFRTGLTASGVSSSSDVMFMSLTAEGTLMKPTIGVDNTDPFSLFEIGNTFRTSIGEFGSTGSYIAFNAARSPVVDQWRTNNFAKVVWEDNSNFKLNYGFASTTTGTSLCDDYFIKNYTRFTVDYGAIRISDLRKTHESPFGATSIGLHVDFGPTGTTGSGMNKENWRRGIALFGNSNTTFVYGSPYVCATNGYNQSYAIASYNGASVLPQYTFWGSGADTCGLYLGEGTPYNIIDTQYNFSVGLAIGGTSGISVHSGDENMTDIRVGISNKNPYTRLHIGNQLTFNDIDNNIKSLNFNTFQAGDETDSTYLVGDASIKRGYVELGFPEQLKTDAQLVRNRFVNTGTKLAIELGNRGIAGDLTDSPLSPSGLMYRGVIMSPPLETFMTGQDPHNYSNYIPQVSIGIPLDLTEFEGTDTSSSSTISSKRGSLVIGAQYRTINSTTTNDIYNIGLYSYDGDSVLGIGVTSGGPAFGKTVSMKFFGKDQTVQTDIDLFRATISTNDYTLGSESRVFELGDGFRAYINATSVPQSSASIFDHASLNVGSGTLVGMAINSIGSVIVDSSEFNAYANYGLIIKNGACITGTPTQTLANNTLGIRASQVSSSSYTGDWSIKYATSTPTTAGLHFSKIGGGSTATRAYIDDNGSFGIGTTAFGWSSSGYSYHGGPGTTWTNTPNSGTAKLAVSGGISCEYIFTSSDSRIKEDIKLLDYATDKLKLLKPSSFSLKETPGVVNYGFIAQDVAEIYPDTVRIFEDPRFEDGRRTIDYNSMIAILTKGFQEQQTLIEEKDKEIQLLEERLSNIEKFLMNKF